MEDTKNFKHTLPGGCPGSFIKDKELEEGIYGAKYFRICKNSPPTEEDFIPLFFLARCRDRVDKMNDENDYPGLCQMASASILKTEEDAIKLIRKFKKVGNYIFCGTITKNDGLIVNSPSKDFPRHCSFFVYEGVNESRIFQEGIYP